eukprot:CAMPEP_0184518266 /NCGR_PEP_ID=MMETSP0198_2-20121128/5996_1 /TAXON_ID=1112570 /ORGANISM="Thraustochytrium sp., Strain LLF1b" /LENGTH=418 /DNA_ID=CAMNT_0026908693 /DNA_START=115 /DNA_END=1371 /DNA_ORIENTATION=-
MTTGPVVHHPRDLFKMQTGTTERKSTSSLKQLLGVYNDLNQDALSKETERVVAPERHEAGNSSDGETPLADNTAFEPFGQESASEKPSDLKENKKRKLSATGKREKSTFSKPKIDIPAHVHSQLARNNSCKTNESVASDGSHKRRRFTWNAELHQKFLAAIFDIGLQQAKPKLIMQQLTEIPQDLTTEHIKSHLQKYRKNCKQTKQVFLEQFKIAKAQKELDKGKAFNPGFHAYPFPVGHPPSNFSTSQADHDVDQQSISTSTSPVRHAVIHERPSMPSLADQALQEDMKALNGNSMRLNQLQTYGPSSSSSSSSFAAPKPVVFDQMEMQMKIHRQIQEQHALQQSAHSTKHDENNLPDPDSQHQPIIPDIGNPPDLSDMSPYLSFAYKSIPTPLILDGDGAADDELDFREDLFDFLQ